VAVRRRSFGGFSLVEVLVALFVLAVGVVGAAATQATAERTRQHSALMSGAVQLASSLAERMRANPAAMAAADAANPYLQLDYDASGGPPVPALTPCYGDANCTPPELAEHDLYDIRRALYLGFPNGRVLVCRDATVVNAASGALSWDCEHAAGAPLVVKLGWRGKGGDPGADLVPAVAIIAPGTP
jgi:type IV pilus assembly protein PilV